MPNSTDIQTFEEDCRTETASYADNVKEWEVFMSTIRYRISSSKFWLRRKPSVSLILKEMGLFVKCRQVRNVQEISSSRDFVSGCNFSGTALLSKLYNFPTLGRRR